MTSHRLGPQTRSKQANCYHTGILLAPYWCTTRTLLVTTPVPSRYLPDTLLVPYQYPPGTLLVPYWYPTGTLLVPHQYPPGTLLSTLLVMVLYWYVIGSLQVCTDALYCHLMLEYMWLDGVCLAEDLILTDTARKRNTGISYFAGCV